MHFCGRCVNCASLSRMPVSFHHLVVAALAPAAEPVSSLHPSQASFLVLAASELLMMV